MADLISRLESALRAAMAAAYPEAAGAAGELDPQLRPSTNPAFGDYQANAAMSLAKKLGKNPREAAAAIVAKLDFPGLAAAPEIAGPGFINLRLTAACLSEAVEAQAADPAAGIPAVADPAAAGTVVVDYSAPNVAKEMHVGHLRSTIIGDAIVRVLQATGRTVLKRNHLGDWGTQFGMLIEYIRDAGWDEDSEHAISDLNELYRSAKARFDADSDFAERARGRVVALQAGDAETVKLWRQLIEESKHHFAAVYERLGVLLTDADYYGESFYNPLLAPAVADLLAAGTASLSNGAVCLFPPGFKAQDGEPLPLIVRKSDGGYGYDATDLAALRYRVDEEKAGRLIYVTDARQKQHFAMVFAGARLAGWLPENVAAEHVPFGSVLGEDGKPFKSRSGENVRLSELLDEAEKRAFDLVTAKSPELPEAERRSIARAVGIGAVKYADLANDRIKDYVFAWDRMLAFDGNTAPYLQNAYVRIKSIFRKAEEKGAAPGAIAVAEAEERLLALELLNFGPCVASVARSLEPHRLGNYLYDLASRFHRFYEACPVLAAEPAVRASRLALCAETARVIQRGLDLMGIKTVEKM